MHNLEDCGGHCQCVNILVLGLVSYFAPRWSRRSQETTTVNPLLSPDVFLIFFDFDRQCLQLL